MILWYAVVLGDPKTPPAEVRNTTLNLQHSATVANNTPWTLTWRDQLNGVISIPPYVASTIPVQPGLPWTLEAGDPLLVNGEFLVPAGVSASNFYVAVTYSQSPDAYRVVPLYAIGVVQINGTAQVSVSGGTVDIGNTPAVTISGTPSVTVSSGSVDIANTPSVTIDTTGGAVDVTGSVDASITGTVDITGPVTISAGQSDLEVQVDLVPERVATLTINAGASSATASFTPPAGATALMILIPGSLFSELGAVGFVQAAGASTGINYIYSSDGGAGASVIDSATHFSGAIPGNFEAINVTVEAVSGYSAGAQTTAAYVIAYRGNGLVTDTRSIPQTVAAGVKTTADPEILTVASGVSGQQFELYDVDIFSTSTAPYEVDLQTSSGAVIAKTMAWQYAPAHLNLGGMRVQASDGIQVEIYAPTGTTVLANVSYKLD